MVYFNAHMATYLALLNGFALLPIPTMSWLKNVMKKFKRDGKEEKEAQKTDRPLLIPNDLKMGSKDRIRRKCKK